MPAPVPSPPSKPPTIQQRLDAISEAEVEDVPRAFDLFGSLRGFLELS